MIAARDWSYLMSRMNDLQIVETRVKEIANLFLISDEITRTRYRIEYQNELRPVLLGAYDSERPDPFTN
jgi:hypothetical protein